MSYAEFPADAVVFSSADQESTIPDDAGKFAARYTREGYIPFRTCVGYQQYAQVTKAYRQLTAISMRPLGGIEVVHDESDTTMSVCRGKPEPS
jgi:hypothetical protein